MPNPRNRKREAKQLLDRLKRGPASLQPEVGDDVRLRLDYREVRGRVTEDRGPIGVGGRRLYGVEYAKEGGEVGYVELPADQIEQCGGCDVPGYTIWLNTWVIPELKKLIPELRDADRSGTVSGGEA